MLSGKGLLLILITDLVSDTVLSSTGIALYNNAYLVASWQVFYQGMHRAFYFTNLWRIPVNDQCNFSFFAFSQILNPP
jgi:hypothetical protein